MLYRGKSEIWIGTAAVVLLALAALAPNLSALWVTDDYYLVYGIYRNPSPSFADGLSRSLSGAITAHRLLTYWMIGIGGMLGPRAAHGLALALHLVCAAAFAGLVWRLFQSFMVTLMSAAWFVLAPWVSEPVLWWSAVCTIVSTIFMLCAAHCFLNSYTDNPSRRLAWTVASCFFVLMSLFSYDLWLAGFPFFVGLGVLYRKDERNVANVWRNRVQHIAPMIIPFLVWIVWVAITGPWGHSAGRIGISVARVPVVFASIHLRTLNWFWGPDWVGQWRMGLEALRSPLNAILFVAGLGALALLLARQVAKSERTSASDAQFPWNGLFLCWMIFLSSRLIIILAGGTAAETRLNYGAGMAVALAAALLARWVWNTCLRSVASLRWSSAILATLSVGIIALALAGKAELGARSSQAQAYTLARLHEDIRTNPAISSITVFGEPVRNVGEMPYFSGDETWLLGAMLRQTMGDSVMVVTQQDTNLTLPASSSRAAVYRWSGEWPAATLRYVP